MESLAPRYIGPFPVVTQVGKFAYRLDLPNSMNGMHNVLHGFMLRKYLLKDQENHFTLEHKTIQQGLIFKVYLVRILEGFDSVMMEESQVCEGSSDKSDRT